MKTQMKSLALLALSLLIGATAALAEETTPGIMSERILVPACKNSDRGKRKSPEACLWWFRAPNEKIGQKTAKLVVFFAGAEQSCAITGAENSQMGYGKLAQSYLKSGYIFVCANLFEKPFSPWTGKLPFYAEARRIDALMKNIATHPDILKRWSGEKLLISGTDLGATAPVVAMKHNHFDKQPHWKGTKTTGACFLDGQYDVYFNQLFWLLPEHQASCSTMFERNVCERYLGKKECDVQTRNIQAIEADTLVGTDTGINSAKAGDFEIPNWKLVECGSTLPACGGSSIEQNDVYPAAPIRAFCDVLKTGAAEDVKNCVYSSEPTKSHTDCGLQGVADMQCINWFDALN